MKLPNYSHLISTFQEDGAWFVRIERFLPDGRRDWLNDNPIPAPGTPEDWDLFESFMGNIGKTVGIDSPGVRVHFGFDGDDQLLAVNWAGPNNSFKPKPLRGSA